VDRVTEPDCLECRIAREGERQGGLAWRSGAFLVHPRLDASPVPGWLVVAPLRHVESVDALTREEQAALGPLVAEVAGALRAETPCAKIYVSSFGEVVPHLHVHVVARPPDLPEDERGARLFTSGRRADEAELAALARRVFGRLDGAINATGRRPRAEPARAGSPWRAVLLSGLVWPGLGQLLNRHYLKAAAFMGGTVAVVGLLLVRVVREALLLVPTDSSTLDPFLAFTLAAQIQQSNRVFFLGVTLALVVLWVLAVVDAWRGATSGQR